MFHGITTALVTPFKKGEVDFASLRKLVRWQLDQGVQGFVVSGTTGESPTLTASEKEELFNYVAAEVSNQVPILLGTGTNNTQTTIEATQKAEKLKASGALVVTPYYNKPPQRGLVAHFKAVAQNTSLPIVLYNVPGRTACSLEPVAAAELSQITNIVGIKDATGNLKVFKELQAQCRPGFSLLSGDDGTYLEFIAGGGHGVISVLSHVIPAQMRKDSEQVRSEVEAQKLFKPFAQLTDLLFAEANPIPVKAALKLMGVIESDELRLPLVSCSEQVREQLKNALKQVGVLP